MVRLFKKPKYDKAEAFEDLNEQVKKLGLDVKLNPNDYFNNLLKLNYALSKKIESSQSDYEKATQELEKKYLEIEKTHLERVRKNIDEINQLEAVLVVKRQEQRELEKPLAERIKLLDERETDFTIRFKDLVLKEQSVLEREREADSKLDSVKDLADELGENRVRLVSKERMIDIRSKGLEERENQYLIKSEQHRIEIGNRWKEIHEREAVLDLKEASIQGKEENLTQREEKLIQDKLLVQSQRQALLAAQQHGNKRIIRSGRK